MACIKWVLLSPTPSIDKEGIVRLGRPFRHRQGEAAWAKRLELPTTKESKVYSGLSTDDRGGGGREPPRCAVRGFENQFPLGAFLVPAAPGEPRDLTPSGMVNLMSQSLLVTCRRVLVRGFT